MPAPAVIPAPIAYIIDVAVETFVVELFLLGFLTSTYDSVFCGSRMSVNSHLLHVGVY